MNLGLGFYPDFFGPPLIRVPHFSSFLSYMLHILLDGKVEEEIARTPSAKLLNAQKLS
jgi:hypothetical protein